MLYLRPCASEYTDERFADAWHMLRPCTCACAIGRARIRADTGERLSAGVDRVRLRRAGLQLDVGVQREHRRVEHRVCVELGVGMRRLSGPAITSAHTSCRSLCIVIYRCKVRICKTGTSVCSCVRVRLRAGADDALIRGLCASAKRSLRNAIHRMTTHMYSECVRNACMYACISMRG
jgi:hypothetical protein